MFLEIIESKMDIVPLVFAQLAQAVCDRYDANAE
jgi:hypothetical protein